LLLLLATASTFASGDNDAALEYRVKSAFLFNFAKFTEWPDTSFPSANAPIIFTVLGESPIGQALKETISGKSIGARPITVKNYSTLKDYEGAGISHIVFIALSPSDDVKGVFEKSLKDGTLLVTDSNISQGKKGVIDFVMDKNNVRFDVNLMLANQAKIRISSEVLKLARTVLPGNT
jgi:hypothetical protein